MNWSGSWGVHHDLPFGYLVAQEAVPQVTYPTADQRKVFLFLLLSGRSEKCLPRQAVP